MIHQKSIEAADTERQTNQPRVLSAEELHRRLGSIDPIQIQIWREMTPARRLRFAFQAYQFALNAVRLTERERAEDDLTEEEFNWRVTRRMQGYPNLGREYDNRITTK